MSKPHKMFYIWTADQVAECLDGVFSAPGGLYAALWALVPAKRSYDREDCGPSDVIGVDCLADVWGRLSEDHQEKLNNLAVKHEAELANW